MRNVAEYLAQAREFEAMADNTSDAKLKMAYLDLAQSYKKLARERERFLAEKIASGE